jgi:hypothetical protein
MEVIHPSAATLLTKDELEAVGSWMPEFLLECSLRISTVDDAPAYVAALENEEAAMGRALTFANSDVLLRNVLGDALVDELFSPRLSPPGNSTGISYEVRRTQNWNASLNATTETVRLLDGKPGEGEPPADLLQDGDRHDERQILSLINTRLWDRAKWRATAYGTDGTRAFLIIAFENAERAKELFRELHERLGEVDIHEELRVTILTGISRSRPCDYRVIVSSNPSVRKEHRNRLFVLVARTNTMTPVNSFNLDRFLETLARNGGVYSVTCGLLDANNVLRPFFELSIHKKELRVIPAWKLDINDPDLIGIRPGDDPLIPEDVTDVPFRRVQQWQRTLQEAGQQAATKPEE